MDTFLPFNFALFVFLLQPLKNDKYVIPQSRYGYVDMYIASDEYNDTEVPYNETAYKTLRDNGIQL